MIADQPIAGPADLASVLDAHRRYLETDRRENVGLYQRFGYVVTEEAQVRGFALTMWRMVRPPRRGQDD